MSAPSVIEIRVRLTIWKINGGEIVLELKRRLFGLRRNEDTRPVQRMRENDSMKRRRIDEVGSQNLARQVERMGVDIHKLDAVWHPAPVDLTLAIVGNEDDTIRHRLLFRLFNHEADQQPRIFEEPDFAHVMPCSLEMLITDRPTQTKDSAWC